MHRKLIGVLGALSLAAILACGIGVTSSARAQTASGPRNLYVPHGFVTPDAATLRKMGPCPGYVWLKPAGDPKAGWICANPPPRSQADCSPGETFTRLITGTTGCMGGSRLDTIRTDVNMPRAECKHDSDCIGSHVCTVWGYCAPIPIIDQKPLKQDR